MKGLGRSEQKRLDDYRVYVVINYLTYLGIAVHLVLIPLFFWLGISTLAFFNIFSTILWIVARRINSLGRNATASMILLAEVCLHTVLAVYFLGWQSGFQYYLVAAVPFIMFNTKMDSSILLIQSVFICVLFMALNAVSTNRIEHANYPWIIESLNYINIMISFSALIVNSYYFRKAIFITEQQMETLANIDQLTGLTNRRGIHSILNRQYNQFTRNGIPFCLILADIDFFKRINDTFGHDSGDYVLVQIAKILKQRLRQYDVVSRWGGEEFLLILPDTEIEAARVVAEHIRTAVSEQTFLFNGQKIAVTITLGVTQHTADHTLYETIKQADDVLYKGKGSGRNHVVSV